MKSRVIARYKLNIIQIENNKNLLKTNHMYSGTVAELPIPKNKNRCLIFFDNGYVSYVNENEIFYIFDYETMPIERLSFDHSHFLRSYFVTYRTDGTVVVNLNKKDEKILEEQLLCMIQNELLQDKNAKVPLLYSTFCGAEPQKTSTDRSTKKRILIQRNYTKRGDINCVFS